MDDEDFQAALWCRLLVAVTSVSVVLCIDPVIRYEPCALLGAKPKIEVCVLILKSGHNLPFGFSRSLINKHRSPPSRHLWQKWQRLARHSPRIPPLAWSLFFVWGLRCVTVVPPQDTVPCRHPVCACRIGGSQRPAPRFGPTVA